MTDFAWLSLFSSVAVVVYVYAGFPAVLWILQLRRRYHAPQPLPEDDLPAVSMLVAAYNEEKVIEDKLRNCLAIDYPAGKIQFVFVSDSTDGTNEILLRYESERMRVLLLPQRGGKVAALAAALPLCTGDIIVFSDANTYYRPDCLRMLARHFRRPDVGLVTGDVRLLSSKQTFGAGERLYYRYERWLQELETSFWSTVAIDGAMYAVRRSAVQLASHGRVADDLVTGMNTGCQGYRLIYDPEAVADEDPTPTNEQEFARKVRVVAYAIQSVLAGEGVPPIRHGRLWWVFLSHKLLRWLVPVFLVIAFAANALIAALSDTGAVLFAGQLCFYSLAYANWRLPRLQSMVFRIPFYFTMVNAAALLGLVRGIRGRQQSVWARTERSLATHQ